MRRTHSPHGARRLRWQCSTHSTVLEGGRAMSPALRKYVELERIMLDLDAVDERAAEAVREVMDDVWYGLSEDERASLDERSVVGPIKVLEPVRVPVTADVLTPRKIASMRPYDGRPVRGWRLVA